MKLPKTGSEATKTKAPVKKLLKQHGWRYWSPPANQYGGSGISDIHAVKSGLFMCIEAKWDGNDPTPLQVDFLDMVRAAGHMGFVVRETTLDAFAAVLEGLDQMLAAPHKPLASTMVDAMGRLAETEILNQVRFERTVARRAARGVTHVVD